MFLPRSRFSWTQSDKYPNLRPLAWISTAQRATIELEGYFLRQGGKIRILRQSKIQTAYPAMLSAVFFRMFF